MINSHCSNHVGFCTDVQEQFLPKGTSLQVQALIFNEWLFGQKPLAPFFNLRVNGHYIRYFGGQGGQNFVLRTTLTLCPALQIQIFLQRSGHKMVSGCRCCLPTPKNRRPNLRTPGHRMTCLYKQAVGSGQIPSCFKFLDALWPLRLQDLGLRRTHESWLQATINGNDTPALLSPQYLAINGWGPN